MGNALMRLSKKALRIFYLFKIKVEQRSLSLETKNLKPAQIHCVSRGTLICRCMCGPHTYIRLYRLKRKGCDFLYQTYR